MSILFGNFSIVHGQHSVILIQYPVLNPMGYGKQGQFLHVQQLLLYLVGGLPCVIMHRAVEIGAQLIRRGMWQNVLVIGADKAYSDQERVFFHTIMGDGVVALLLSEQAEGNLILSSWISTTIFAPEGETPIQKTSLISVSEIQL